MEEGVKLLQKCIYIFTEILNYAKQILEKQGDEMLQIIIIIIFNWVLEQMENITYWVQKTPADPIMSKKPRHNWQ